MKVGNWSVSARERGQEGKRPCVASAKRRGRFITTTTTITVRRSWRETGPCPRPPAGEALRDQTPADSVIGKTHSRGGSAWVIASLGRQPRLPGIGNDTPGAISLQTWCVSLKGRRGAEVPRAAEATWWFGGKRRPASPDCFGLNLAMTEGGAKLGLASTCFG